MNTKNSMKLSFEARSCNESFARAVVAAFILPLDPTVTEIADIRTAVSEAVTNAIVHGYPDTSGIVYIDAKITDKDILVVRVRDKGVGIADIAKAMEPLYSSSCDERAGLGFSVMQSFTDQLKVRSSPGRGTVVTMYKQLSSAHDKG